jgi:uncharacterized delta-60 repeat protein
MDIHKRIFLTYLIFIAINSVFGQNSGSLDLSFGGAGYVITTLGSSFSWASSMQIQNNGKIIVAGYSVDNNNPAFTLVRYNADGSTDNTFGTNGTVITHIGLLSRANAMVLQTDDKIVVTGYSRINDSTYNYATARYNGDGSPDNSFGTGGIVLTNVENSSNVYGIALQSNGKIVLSGYSSDGTKTGISHVRYNVNGAIDTTFGSGGIALKKFSQSPDVEAWAMAIDADDNIVTTGIIYDTAYNKISVTKFLSNGDTDTSFGSGGIVVTSVSNSDDFGNAVTIQPDGKILLTGDSKNSIVIARYNANGTLDQTFGTDGTVLSDFGTSESEAYGITIQNDGKIIIAGVSGPNAMNTNGNYGLARFNPDGTIDNSFGTNGKVVSDISSGHNDVAFSVKEQSDGKIVASGISYDGSFYNISLARYNNGSTQISSFPHDNVFSVFPNPAYNRLFIHISQPATAELINSVGQKIAGFQLQQGENIYSLEHLSAGLYTLIIRDKNSVSIKKIIKQ